MQRRHTLAISLVLLLGAGAAAAKPMIIGTYDLPQMKAMKLTFPRLLIYDANGKLIKQASWPASFVGLKKAAGDAFCCVSDKPSPPGWKGPPPDCKIVVYGAKVEEHFLGLKTPEGTDIRYTELPAHKYLIVEYYASWCAPCIRARKELHAFLATSSARDTVTVVVDFTQLSPGK